MNRTTWIVAGAFVILGACANSSTTTSTPASTTTSPPTTTVTTAPTTTLAATTTTTGAPVATTSAMLEGNWGSAPVVATWHGVLGWWDGAVWVQFDETTDLPVTGGEDYQAVDLVQQAIITGTPATEVCQVLDLPGIVFDSEELPGHGIAVTAPWVVVPHPVEEIQDDGTYAAFASELLAERGLDVSDPVMKQVLQVDLEGDGVNEVLVVAEDTTLEGLFAEAGDYSIAFMRRVVEGQVQTSILDESVIVDPDPELPPYWFWYTVGAVADLNGDAVMEIVLNQDYYEGGGLGVWELSADGPVHRIRTDCGV